MIPIKQGFLLAVILLSIYSSAALAQRIEGIVVQRARDGSPTHDSSNFGSPSGKSSHPEVYFMSTPSLQGATMGTIGPQGTDATAIQGIMTAGTVRVNNLANLEAALNIVANVALILGHVVGIYYLIKTIRITVKTPGNVLGGLAKGLTFISVGLLTPMFVNWAMAAVRDAVICN